MLPQLRTRSKAHRGPRLLSKLTRRALRQFSSWASKTYEPRSLGRVTRLRVLTAPLTFPDRHHLQGSPGQSTASVTDTGCSRLYREPLGPRGGWNRSCAGSARGETLLSCDGLVCAFEHQITTTLCWPT
jgi:hypothetical protein